MKAEKTFEVDGVKIEIIQDHNPMSPSEWENKDLFLVANHRDFYVPEPGQKRITSDPEELRERWEETHWIFGLEAYIHSGVHLSLSGEGDYPDRRWDVSQLGFVFVERKEWQERDKAREAALCLIGEWNQYLSGDVWGYIVTGPDGEEDSCWGFYGFKYCEEEARGVAAHMGERIRKERAEFAYETGQAYA